MKSTLMKAITLFAIVALGSAVVEQDRTITQVVKLLQTMLEKSKTEGDEERKIYAKFKCYCDQNEAEKKASIKALTEQISLLESKIEETQGSTGGLSSECADLKAKMADNKQARDDATALREKENKAFNAEEADLEQAIKQMKGAIETLAAVGADQTDDKTRDRGDNAQFMAKGAALLQSQMQTALSAATALMTGENLSKTTAFLQAPFTGTYTSQSGAVMGIIKSMRDTFEKNLADARTTEKNALAAYDEFMDIKTKAFNEMKDSYADKQKELGGNDGSLADDKKSLANANKKKDSDTEFLDKLIPMCEDKAEAYANRKLLRTNEEAAIAEAISILNSDDAFASFGKTDATSTGATGFLQLRSVRAHTAGSEEKLVDVLLRNKAQKMLKKAATETHSARLSKVVALLQAENPFDTVLKEIDNMIELIGEEGEADKENLDFCNKERKENKAERANKIRQINGLDSKIDKLKKTINDPKKGLKAVIANTEQSLVDNRASQTSESKTRVEENLAYQQDIKNLVTAQTILKKAIKVLDTYYKDLEAKLEGGMNAGFIQTKVAKEDPAPPDATLNAKGQSKAGNDVIGMLNFILDESVKEENEAHSDEQKAQSDFEDSMADLKKQEASDEKLLADTQAALAEAEEDKLEAEADLKDTTEEKEAIEAYLLKIKPGCDFITENFDTREKNRATEKAALEKAIGLIKGTPAYKTAVNAATVESYGDCKEPCVKDADHVECKACMADVTIPAYCAGHKGTAGC